MSNSKWRFGAIAPILFLIIMAGCTCPPEPVKTTIYVEGTYTCVVNCTFTITVPHCRDENDTVCYDCLPDNSKYALVIR